MTNLTFEKHDEPRPEVDEMLGDYFQAQMPKLWPAFKVPKAPRVRETPARWSRYNGRLALAACVTLLIAGYWSLSGEVAHQSGSGLPSVAPRIGMKPKNGLAPNRHDEPKNRPLVPNGPNPQAK